MEDLTPEQLHHLAAQTELTPEQAYERNWALALLEQARREVRDEYAAAGKLARFGLLEPFLPGDRQELTYAQAGASLASRMAVSDASAHSNLARRAKNPATSPALAMRWRPA